MFLDIEPGVLEFHVQRGSDDTMFVDNRERTDSYLHR